MIKHPAFTVEPWALRETGLDLAVLPESESVLTLANGHIGLRGNLDEGEPAGLTGTYLCGFYESRPLPYAEPAYGYPEDGQTRVNVTDGKIIRLMVDDEPFDLRYGKLVRHERVLDFRDGVLRRRVEWASPAGAAVRVASTRLVSFTQRAVAAILYEVEPVDAGCRVVVQSELVANEPVAPPASLAPPGLTDPRAPAPPDAPLLPELNRHGGQRAVLVHTTASSGQRLGAGMEHVIDGPTGTDVASESDPDLARLTVTAELDPGQRLRIVKFVAYGWSARRSVPVVRDQVDGALSEARHRGWEGLVADQRAYLDDFWSTADVEIDGDEEIQQAVRFALLHVLQASARTEARGIAAKGLTGIGYEGHCFWDTEAFVLPVLTYTLPQAVDHALRWRHSTLDIARARAATLGLTGAAFPWRTIRGEECSSYWPAGTAAFHVNADIAAAVVRYQAAVDDPDFERECGTELLVETARLWRAVGHHETEGRFRIDGVTGPNEYSALTDNNLYTNVMAQQNLRAAATAAERHPRRAAALGVTAEEMAGWRSAAAAMVLPYDEALGVHGEAENFTRHQRWDFEATGAAQYPLMLHFPYFDLYRKQVVKQADVVLALHLRGDAFTAEEKARDFAYYEELTVRDSSLSACTQAVIAAEVGHVDLAYDYLAEAALMDLDDIEGNVRDGLHIASLAGAWLAIVAGLGGLRDHGPTLSFAPRLPEPLSRLAFRLSYRGRRLLVETDHRRAAYSLLSGEALTIVHHGVELAVPATGTVTAPIPPAPRRRRPTQPRHRVPARRGARRSPTPG